MPVSRRSFVRWMAALSAALGIRRRATAQGRTPENWSASGTTAPLDPQLVAALAATVLPSELGADGAGRMARSFSDWLEKYRSGAELLHGYGTAELAYTEATPAGRWGRQLAALDQAARARGGRGFASLPPADREALVRAAVGGEKLAAMPVPQQATHVAIGLLAWYYATPEATDLCYRVQIGKNRCRSLVNNPREPVAPGGPAPAPASSNSRGSRTAEAGGAR